MASWNSATFILWQFSILWVYSMAYEKHVYRFSKIEVEIDSNCMRISQDQIS